MPRIAWDALEAGFDGPAIRRMAALDFPTFFEVEQVLPKFKEDLGMASLPKKEASLRLASLKASRILESNSDPLKHLKDFELLWRKADYCRELQELGCLDDDVHVANCMGQSKDEIRSWVVARLRKIAEVGSA